MSITFLRNKKASDVFNEYALQGKRTVISADGCDSTISDRFYSHPNGELWLGDAINWLGSLESESFDLVFADPPYNIKNIAGGE